MARRGEHRISIVDKASESREGLGTRTHEEVTSPAIQSSADECWTREVQEKIKHAFPGSPQQSAGLSDDERKSKICKFTLGEEFCQPKVVAIGPFHRRESTSISDEEKWWIVGLMNLLCGLDSAHCITKMANQAMAAFERYSDSEISQIFGSKYDKRFAEMLLLDSYFILFMLTYMDVRDLMHRGKLKAAQYPPALRRASDIELQRDKIMLDLLILDNQIPFFVIEELFKDLEHKLGKQRPLHNYALDFFQTIPPRPNQGRLKGRNSLPKFLHLLDLFHWSRVSESKYSARNPSIPLLDSIGWACYIPTAMELRESTTTFQEKTSGSFLDITFERGRLISIMGVLNIPRLHIHDYSSIIFHNLIAFEMQCPHRGSCTIAFSAFMANLLQSEQDVKLLRRRGILADTSMTDKNLVDVFKRLSQLTDKHSKPTELYELTRRS